MWKNWFLWNFSEKMNFIANFVKKRDLLKKTPAENACAFGETGVYVLLSKISCFFWKYWFFCLFSGRLLGHSQVDFSHIFCPVLEKSEARHTIVKFSSKCILKRSQAVSEWYTVWFLMFNDCVLDPKEATYNKQHAKTS
jgi:hypothetical protein